VRVERFRHGMLAAVLALAVFVPAFAASERAEPVAADPVLESQVQGLSHKLRCLVCQNETIATSRAPLAVDLRAQVREQFAAGKSEDEIVDFMVSRYGDFVLYQPPLKASTMLLWFGPGLFALIAAGWLLLRLRRRAQETPHSELSPAERAEARRLLGEDESEEPRL